MLSRHYAMRRPFVEVRELEGNGLWRSHETDVPPGEFLPVCSDALSESSAS